MADSLAGDVAGLALAAGEGTRLRPITQLRPKPLCPVGDRVLLDWALDSLDSLDGAVGDVAVNLHHGRVDVESHLDQREARTGVVVHRSVEAREALGTAGAVGQLRTWLDGRGVLILNADTWHRSALRAFVDDWDGESVRILTPTPLPFTPRSGIVASLLPWSIARDLQPTPSGLWEAVWRDALVEHRLDAVHETSPVIDCGTPGRYLEANMVWSGGESVIGAGAQVEGTVVRSVVWPGSVVGPKERLVDAIRAEDRTILIR